MMTTIDGICRHGSRHRYLSSILLSTTLLFSTTFAHAAGAQPDDVTAAQVFQLSASQDAGTGGGGPWVTESEAIWQRGEISAVEVCHGNYVEKMTVFYNGVRGTVFGNPNAGVGCVTWNNEGGGYLRSIYIYSGVYLDAIEFHPSVGKAVKIGGGGGGRSILEDPNGGAIRTIDAKSGVYLDRVRANFGLPYYIDNLKYDYDALKRQMESTKPEQIDLQTVDACRSSTPLTQKITIEKKIADTHSFSFSNTTAISLTTTVEGGFGDIFKASASTSISTAFTVGNSQSTTTESTYRREVDGRANAGQKVHIVTISKRAELDLPYTYDLIHYKNGNKKDVVHRQTFNGVYKGNKAASTDTTQIDYDCKTNKPIHPDSQPDASSDKPDGSGSTSSSNTEDESGESDVANEDGEPAEDSESAAEPTEESEPAEDSEFAEPSESAAEPTEESEFTEQSESAAEPTEESEQSEPAAEPTEDENAASQASDETAPAEESEPVAEPTEDESAASPANEGDEQGEDGEQGYE